MPIKNVVLKDNFIFKMNADNFSLLANPFKLLPETIQVLTPLIPENMQLSYQIAVSALSDKVAAIYPSKLIDITKEGFFRCNGLFSCAVISVLNAWEVLGEYTGLNQKEGNLSAMTLREGNAYREILKYLHSLKS